MDLTDRKIASLIQKNARLTLKQLSEVLGISSPAVSARLNKLEKSGFFEGFYAKVDREKAGYGVTAYIGLEIIHGKETEFCQYVNDQACVQDCYFITGQYSVMIKAVFPYTMALDTFVGTLHQYGRTTTNIAISKIVERTTLPL